MVEVWQSGGVWFSRAIFGFVLFFFLGHGGPSRPGSVRIRHCGTVRRTGRRDFRDFDVEGGKVSILVFLRVGFAGPFES